MWRALWLCLSSSLWGLTRLAFSAEKGAQSSLLVPHPVRQPRTGLRT